MADINLNPLADLLRDTGSPDLAGSVVTVNVSYESSSSITEYPVESGGTLLDHVRVAPDTITLSGTVGSGANEGEGARLVDEALRRLLDRAVPVTLRTSRGLWDNCVMTQMQSTQSSSNINALEFTVEFVRAKISDITAEVVEFQIDPDRYQQKAEDEMSDVPAVSNVTDDTAPPAYNRAEPLGFDVFDFVKDQLNAAISQGLDEDSFGKNDVYEIARQASNYSPGQFNRIQVARAGPLPILGQNFWNIPIPPIEDNQNVIIIQEELRAQDNFPFAIRIKLLYAQTYGIAVDEPPTAQWYISYGLGQLGAIDARNNQRAQVGLGMPIGKEPRFGGLYIVPRLSIDSASEDILTREAFSVPNFRIIHVTNPEALLS